MGTIDLSVTMNLFLLILLEESPHQNSRKSGSSLILLKKFNLIFILCFFTDLH
jgi:hypothetical protein